MATLGSDNTQDNSTQVLTPAAIFGLYIVQSLLSQRAKYLVFTFSPLFPFFNILILFCG